MTDHPLIYAALADVMSDCREVAKRETNTQQHFNFRGIDAVVNAVGPILRKHRVIVVPSLLSAEYVPIQTRNGGIMTSARVQVAYLFWAEDGSSIEARVAAESFDAGDKAMAKAMSVAFRTALLQALALPTDDKDPDATSYERVQPQHVPPMPDNGPPPQYASPETKGDGWPETPAPGTRTMSRQQGGSRRKPTDPISPEQLTLVGTLMTKLQIPNRETAVAYVSDVVKRPIKSRKDLTLAEASQVIHALKVDLGEEPPDA